MSITVEQIPDSPIFIITVPDDAPLETLGEALQTSLDVSSHVEGTVFRIFDFSDLDADFGDLVQIMGMTTRRGADEESSFHNLRFQNAIVSRQELFKMGAAAYGQEQYGDLDVPFFPSLEEALVYARSQLVR